MALRLGRRTYAELLRAKAERALEVADMLEPNHRKRRRTGTGQVADGRGGFVGEPEPVAEVLTNH